MTPAHLEIRVTMTLSLAEALTLEARLAGGPETAASRTLGAALSTQLAAASAALDAPAVAR